LNDLFAIWRTNVLTSVKRNAVICKGRVYRIWLNTAETCEMCRLIRTVVAANERSYYSCCSSELSFADVIHRMSVCVCVCVCIYRVSHELRSLLRESVPNVKIYRYNPKHLYPKLNGYGDNGKRSLKVRQLLHTYWLPNSYWNWQEYVVSVMLISVLNIRVTCAWHKAIKLKHKNIRIRVIVILRVRSTIHDTGMPNADVTWLAWLKWLTMHSVTWHPMQGRT